MAYDPSGRAESSVIPAPVSSLYAVPYTAHFQIDQRVSDPKFKINDADGALLFNLRRKQLPSFHTRRTLRDSTSKTVLVTLKKKIATLHERWWAYRGKNENERLFTMSKGSLLQMTPSFHVFLAANETSKPDFVLKGNFLGHNYTILYRGVPIAQVHKEDDMPSMMCKDQYGVTVFPGVDHAFIASLIVLVDLVNHKGK